MKYKYHKGSEADFDGAPQSATVKLRCGMFATAFADSFTNGATRTDMISGLYNSEIRDIGNFQLIAHREPISTSEVSGDTHLSQAIQNTAQDVSKIIDKEIKGVPITTTEALITERGTRYGKFKDGADIMQSLKDTMRDVDGWNNLTASQKEALDMIQHKIGRILNGDPTYDDSWKDIAGYATLIVNELNGEVK